MSSLLILMLTGLLGTAVAVPAPGTSNFVDLPVAETAFDGDLPQVGAVDRPPRIFALPDGRVIVLGLEDFKLKEMVSFDGGATFAGEAVVAGGPGGRDILEFDASSDGLGRLAVALIVADPAGDRGLQFVHSSDFGQTWSDPRDLVVKGDPSHGVESVAISAAPEGRIAIAYMASLGGGSGDPYAVVSDDSGATWTTPVRLNSDQAALTLFLGLVDVEVDPSGRPQVVWSLYEPDAGYALFASRSLNAGLTFEPPLRLSDLVTGGPVEPRSFDLGLAGDGGIVVGFVNVSGGVHALLSPDGGSTFFETLYYPTYTGRAGSNVLRVITDRSTPVVLLTLSTTSRLFVFNSPNGGAGFAGPATVTTTLARRTAPAGTFTPAGHWALAWMDVSGDPLARQIYDIFVSVSANGGASWGTRVRVDTDPPGSAMSQLGTKGIAASGADDLVLAYADGRDDGGGSANVYSNRSGASAPNFSASEHRIDGDGPPVAPSQSAYADSAVATDGASHVYHAFTARSPGPREDLYLAVSSDWGETFGPIVRLGDSAPGEAANSSPQLKAFPDGRVYLAYLRLNPDSGEYEIRFNRSDDYGSSWQPSDVLVGISQLYEWAMDATPFGLVHVAFSDFATASLVVASSRDRGETFDFSTLGDVGYYLSLCAQGEQVIVARDYDGAFVSEDGGESWSDPAPCGGGNAFDIHVACNGQGGALVTCTTGAPDTPPFARRYHAETGWSPDQTVSGPSGTPAYRPRATFSSASRAIVVWEDLAPGVYAALSTDGGETFPSFLRLDDPAPEPLAISYAAQIVADGAGNLFAGWVDGSAGELSVATRASRDGGATWGPVYRVDREMPQGSRENWYQYYTTQNSAALPGRGFFAWESQRESYNRKALFNAYDLTDIDFDDIPEDDGDGSVDPCQAGSAAGCDDNCAAAENPDQADADGDGIGDACDACGLDPANDGDADQVCGNVDNCPERANPDQRDGDGNGLGDVCDEPRVAAVSPGDNATGVPVFVDVTLAFVEPVVPETVGDVDGDGTSDTVLLLADGVPVSGAVTVGPDGLTATFNPDDPLVPSTLYEVRATAGIEDLQERSLTPFTSFFETSASDQPAAENLGDAGEPSRGTQQDEQYGSSLGSAGDVNGDGLSDWLVGAPGYDTSDKAASTDAGRVLLFLGSTDEAERSRPDVVFVGGLTGERLGSAIGSGEDLNGDGIPDLLLGAEQTDPGGLDVRGPGRAYLVYFDPADFPDLGQTPEPYEVDVADAAAVVFVGTTDGDRAGHSVSLSPDVNGDGVADLLIGAPGTDRDGLVDRGASYLVLGGQPLPSMVELSQVGLYEPEAVNGIAYLGGSPGDGLGWSVSAAEDFDGDGRADVLLGAPFRDVELATSAKQAALDVGSAYLDCGPKSGTFSRGVIEVDGIIFDGRVTLEIVGDQAGQNLGYAVALTGDHDGDHTADAFVGAPGSDVEGQEDAGEAFFIVNAALREKRGVIEVDRIRQPGSSAGAAYQGSAAGNQTGFSVGDGGDVNGDGVDDALIGAPGADVEEDSSAKQGLLLEDAGETYLDYGTTSQLLGRGVIEVDSIGTSRPGVIYRGENAGDRSGSAVAGVGDADGDGLDNVAIGAPSADDDATSDAGASYLVTAPAPISDGSTSCGPAGCVATDLDTGAQLEIPPESLPDPARVRIDGITDERELPAPVPSGRGFVGGADLDPDGLDFDLPLPTLTLPVDPLVQDQLTAGESLPLAYFDGSRWVMSGENGLVGPNPKYPERLAVSGPIDSLHAWCATFPDLDGDGTRDERDDDRDGDGVLNASDNCPSQFNPDQADRDGDGTGDACEAIFAPLAPPDGTLVYRGRPETFSWSWPYGEATFGVFWSSTASTRPLPPFVQSPSITSLSYTPTAAEWERILALGCNDSGHVIFWRVAGTFDRKTLIGLVRTLVLAEPDQVCAKR